jgi:hypothetical protein
MPPDKRIGPDITPGRSQAIAASEAKTSVTASPMRRRRDASRRLPVLASGYHDPLDGLRRPVRWPGWCCRAVLGADGRWRQCCRGDAA